MESIKKEIVFKIHGSIIGTNDSRKGRINIEIKEKEDKKPVLSITGDIYNRAKTDYICCGQIIGTIRQAFIKGLLSDISISNEDFKKVLEYWERWHLNDLNADCMHQRERKEKYKKYLGDSFFYAQNYAVIVSIPEFKKCPVCGYTYGTSWIYEPLPNHIIEFFKKME